MRTRLLALGGMILATGLALACCVVTHSDRANMMHQQNIIVWEPDTKTEHFIRNAKFESKAQDLGFIAPTPSIPKMEEVEREAFETLESLCDAYQAAGPTPAGAMDEAAASKVDVVQEVEVASYKAVTLKATDAKGLADWMTLHGFVSTPSIKTWTEFYIRKGWYLTAFKVNVNDGRAETGLVKMSFKTDKPFNPYYVPADNVPSADRREGLVVYFVSSGVYAPKGEHPSFRVSVAAPLRIEDLAKLKGELKLTALPRNATVTSFTDHTFPNGANDDLYFEQTGPPPEWPKERLLTSGVVPEDRAPQEAQTDSLPMIVGFAAVLVAIGGALLWRNRK
ncbi:MAG: DUF2330 domain-containing protein [Fimbriimonadaceae bacterium]